MDYPLGRHLADARAMIRLRVVESLSPALPFGML
jgi:hypothetical protein